jgi:hypothetical protein
MLPIAEQRSLQKWLEDQLGRAFTS